jgi:glycosyltransferase involved in cell wall biosynthesis
MKVALIHDWLTGMRGGEKCLEALCELFPDATIFTLVHTKGSVSPVIEAMDIRTSFVQNLPFVAKRYRSYLPLFPIAFEQFDVREFDLVISSSHCAAKGVIPHPDAFHLCYCHTPMRYVWAMYKEYFGRERLGRVSRIVIPLFANYLRMWDVASTNRVDRFVANSENVKKRIRRYYRRESDVIYPPVDTKKSRLSESNEGYFLIVSAFAPYKRIDLAIEAFNQLGEPLVVIGTGPEEKRLRSMARPNIHFAGWMDSGELGRYYAGCRALIFPGEEDFGIVPVEAQCWGKPVIAYGSGGALETVIGQPSDGATNLRGKFTGLFFFEQTSEQLIQTVRRFKESDFDPVFIRKHARLFDKEFFKKKIKRLVEIREKT